MKQSHAETLSILIGIEEQMEKLFEKNAEINDNRKALKKALKENNAEVSNLFDEYMKVQANHPAMVVIRRVYMAFAALMAGVMVWAYVSASREEKGESDFEKRYDVVKASMLSAGDLFRATSGENAGSLCVVLRAVPDGEYVWVNNIKYLADDYVDAVIQ